MPNQKHTDELMRHYYYLWQANPTIENALDVLCYAQTAKDNALAYGAAEQILKTKGVLPGVYDLAHAIRHRPKLLEDDIVANASQNIPLIISAQRQKIHEARQRLIDDPRNSLLWLELSRLHIGLGNNEHADAAMRKALAATPDNRLILRAASRLYIHLGCAEDAHECLLKSDALKVDPWLQAAEISVAAVSGKGSVTMKSAKAHVADLQSIPIHFSELSAAIGTEELNNGKVKLAKKFISKCLENPTDNSVAQALWARERLNTEVLLSLIERTPNTYEAQSGYMLYNGDYKAALAAYMLWHFDEFFSPTPSIQGSFIALTFLEDYETALHLVNLGLKANPNNPFLLNNGVVALAKLNRTAEARTKIKKLLSLRTENLTLEPTFIATEGLLLFCEGKFLEGRKKYSQAAQLAAAANTKDVEFRVKLHWLREEVLAKQITPEEMMKIVNSLDEAMTRGGHRLPFLTRKTWEHFKKKILDAYMPDTEETGRLQLF